MRFDADINARSLGGLPLTGGGETVPGIWRSATPDPLGDEGWVGVANAGIVRIVDLRNSQEHEPASTRPAVMTITPAPLEDPDDPDYTGLWDRKWAHPDFYAWGLTHWPDLWRAAFTAIADAPDGAVLIHCAGGRDRTGILSAILLEFAEVERGAVIEDYVRGIFGTNEMLARQGRSEHESGIPAERLSAIIAEYGAALDHLLDELPHLLRETGLAPVAVRAAERIVDS